ncbi:hypothetical protein TNCV_484311 [Trichonephila clavipes]|nr:hypothetical protein TNCV_484311 [Trichonephila clavipes]
MVGRAGGVIFYVTWSIFRIRYYQKGTPMNQYLYFTSVWETHKDPVGTALHIQEEENMDDTTQTNQLQHKSSRLHDYRETSEEKARFPENIGFLYSTVSHVTFL